MVAVPGMRKVHTDRGYEEQLRKLRESLLLMAGRVEEMIQKSVKALVERDSDMARACIALDHKVNRSELDTDEMCLRILVTRQPVASDLRFLTLALKMVTDLERIGDLAVNICERALDLNQDDPLKQYDDIPEMAQIVQSMVHDAIDAFVAGDVDKAEEVIDRDDSVDKLYTRVFQEVLELMRKDPSKVERGVHVQSVAKWLERMADHATNIAEQVVFMVAGEDIRHLGKLDEDS